MKKHTTPSESTELPVWFITGCSSGFGQELAKQAIERGHRTRLPHVGDRPRPRQAARLCCE